MSLFHVLRVLFAVAFSGAVGWASLIAFNAVKFLREFENFEVAAPNVDLEPLLYAMERSAQTVHGGSMVFLAVAIVGVLFSEIFRSRSLIFYAGATGALTAALAVGWRMAAPEATPVSALAMAGFVAGGIYWAIASPRERRQ
jgi:hypothetical protein